VCGQQNSKSCCDVNQVCCNARECCSVEAGTQNCASNQFNGPPQNQLKCCRTDQVNCNSTCCTTGGATPTQRCFADQKGVATCCDLPNLCVSESDGVQQCCSSSAGEVCQRNTTASGAVIRRCCLAGYPLCPKNNFQPVCCPPGKCPPPDTADFCLP
jgi:hypothetical protein